MSLNFSSFNLNQINNPEPKNDSSSSLSLAFCENEELNLSNSFVNSVISNSPTDSDNNDNEINNVRKNFTRIRKYSLQRNLSKKNIQNKKTGKISLDMGEKIYSDINNDRKESKDSVTQSEDQGQLSMYNFKLAELAQELDKIDTNNMTPIEALTTLQKLKEIL